MRIFNRCVVRATDPLNCRDALGPMRSFCYSLANVSSPSFLLVISLIMRTTVNNISWKGALLACFIRSRSPSLDRRQEALQHVEEKRKRERREVTRTRFSVYFPSPHQSPMWVDKPPLFVLLKRPRLRMTGGLGTWVYACWLKAFMAFHHASPWGNTWCWWDEMCVVVRRDGKGRKGGGREDWGEKMRKGMCAWCYKWHLSCAISCAFCIICL